MVLRSLIAEITGHVPPQAKGVADDIAPGHRLIVVFEDTLGALRQWQNDLLRDEGDTLRDMAIWVACIPSDGQPTLLNGRPVDLPVEELRHALSQTSSGKSQVVVLDYDGNVILEANGPVTIGQLINAAQLGGAPSASRDRDERT
jgi:hypothetical protein